MAPEGGLARVEWAALGWGGPVLALYLAILAVLSLNGLHRLWLVWVWLTRRPRITPADPAVWPLVTVQLPIFNEQFVVERLIRSAAALDYPRDLLEIQVLDDSTDATTSMAATEVERLRGQGIDIRLVHRTDRRGFKAGALEAGLHVARGDVLAVVDADFIPPPDFLRRTVPWLQPGVGMVQTRWGHLNAGETWLTRVQATLLDGHFVIEHTARHRSGRWFNFNGTAGIWRRDAILGAGGWQHDTLTEDLDLSYRSQLAGWRFVYLDHVVTPAELPADIRAFKLQQRRWARGSVQTCRKLLGRIWASEAPLAVKVEATTHLTSNFSYPLVILLTLLLPVAVAARILTGPSILLLVDSVLFVFALLPFVAFYGAAILGSGAPGVGGRLVRLPLVLAVGLGLAVSQTRAVAEGLGREVGVFARTPKTGGSAARLYAISDRGLVGTELALALYMGIAAMWAVGSGFLAAVPFMGLFALGYGAVGVSSLRR